MNERQFVKFYNICEHHLTLDGFDGSAVAEVKQILKIGAVSRDEMCFCSTSALPTV